VGKERFALDLWVGKEGFALELGKWAKSDWHLISVSGQELLALNLDEHRVQFALYLVRDFESSAHWSFVKDC